MRALLLALLIGVARAGAEAPGEEIVEALQRQVELLRAGTSATPGGELLTITPVLADIYERRGFRPEWTTPTTRDGLLEAIRDSAANGLDPGDYHQAAIERLTTTASHDPRSEAEIDLLLTDGLIRLAYHARFGKVDPERLDPNWNFGAPLLGPDPVAALQRAIDEGTVAERIQSLYPQQPFYRNLKTALAEYRRLAAAGGWPSVPSGPVLRAGADDPRIPALRRRLSITGDLPAGTDTDATTFDDGLERAVRIFQERHGLPADGVVGATTIQALDVPVERRIAQLRATLERCRWVMHDLPERFVLVNIAGFMVYVLQDGTPIWETRGVVGTQSTRTPIFRADMRYIVLNPTWTIPPGIMRKEIGPAMRRDPKYLQRKGFVMVGGQVVQPAGENNALGRLKLVFPNPHHVYLHDTPSKSAFNETSRSFSHGCVRVQNPVDLAVRCLDDPAWTADTLRAAIATNRTRTISLTKPLPVLILYWTAAVGRDGLVYFLPDIYGRDPAVIRGLGGAFSLRQGLRVPSGGT